MAEDDYKTALRAELDASRQRIGTNFHALRGDLDIPKRAKQAFARQPIAWVAGASVIGLILAKLTFGRKKTVVVKRVGKETAVEKVEKTGLALGVLKIAFDMARPALTKWLTQYATDYVHQKMTGPSGRA